ncbi:MAG: hypothetical protein AAF321_07310 [Pseudomonadota bacterium]
MLEAGHTLQHLVFEGLKDAGDGAFAGVWLFLIGLAFGALHTLLPGHGKTVLASHHAALGRGRAGLGWSGLARAGADGLLIGMMRVTSAVLIVLAGWSLLERTIGGAMRAPLLEALGGAVLVGLGLWMLIGTLRAWGARSHVNDTDGAPMRGPAERLPALAIGLVPDPVTAVVMSYAVFVGERTLGFVVMIGIALGMAATLTLSASAGLATSAGATARSGLWDRWLRLIGGTLILGIGARMVLRAF